MAATDAARMIAADFMVMITVVMEYCRCLCNQFMSDVQCQRNAAGGGGRILVTW